VQKRDGSVRAGSPILRRRQAVPCARPLSLASLYLCLAWERHAVSALARPRMAMRCLSAQGARSLCIQRHSLRASPAPTCAGNGMHTIIWRTNQLLLCISRAA
jgi:hypothetical protein